MWSSLLSKLILVTITSAFIGFYLFSTSALARPSPYLAPLNNRPQTHIFSASSQEIHLGFQVDLTTTPPPPPSNFNRQILAARPVLGFYNQSKGPLADWMAHVPDNTSLISINIPGTHDSATWNYTDATQQSMTHITGQLPPAIAFQCQNTSLFKMLGDGIRFFDLRVGFLPGSQQLGFFHASALLSSQATLPDVLSGFYQWLEDYPTETVLISIKVDNATFADPPSKKQPSSAKLQNIIQKLLTDDIGSRYWLQKNGTLGNLGDARGKLIFIQRTQWDTPILGISLPPSQFNDNDPSFALVYNERTGATAYIEDFYNILPNPTSFKDKVNRKVEAIIANLKLANSPNHINQLFISFASGGALRNTPPVTPQMLAVGANHTAGVNSGLADYVDQHRGERFGVVLLDWYDATPGLVENIIYRSSYY